MDIPDRFYFTKACMVVTATIASISCLSSLATIMFILRSRKNTSYHRIMFGLSFADIMTSAAMALITLPMPRDVIYPFSGPSYGTVGTCEAQAFIYIVGGALTIAMISILNIYYVCILTLNVKLNRFARCIEPLLCVPIITTVVTTVTFLLLRPRYLNPTPTDPFCAAGSYPYDCHNEAGNDLQGDCRGNGSVENTFSGLFYATFGVGYTILILSMIAVIYTFYKEEQKVKEKLESYQADNIAEGLVKELENAQKSRKNVSKQALMYIVAFTITWAMVLIDQIGGLKDIYCVQVLRMILQPSQGFFNMFIFFYYKVADLINQDEDRTVREAIRIIFNSPGSCPTLVISNITLVHYEVVRNKLKMVDRGSLRAFSLSQHSRANEELERDQGVEHIIAQNSDESLVGLHNHQSFLSNRTLGGFFTEVGGFNNKIENDGNKHSYLLNESVVSLRSYPSFESGPFEGVAVKMEGR